MDLPRHVIPKRLAKGATAFYYNVPTKYRALKCPVSNEPLGKDFAKMIDRAKTLNDQFDEWDQARKGLPVSGGAAMPKYGTVDWLFREYKISKAYLEKVAPRSRSDYEWAMDQICDIKTKSGDRIGGRLVKTISPRAADKLYDKFLEGTGKKKLKNTQRLRTGEKLIGLCRKAWRVVHRLFPAEFDKEVPNPWTGVTLKVRTKVEKPAVTRDEVYAFAWGAVDAGYPEAAATAVICFEWLQRPENVVAGHMKWSDYRAPSAPSIIRVVHHKTGTMAPHPLEEVMPDGLVQFYAEAEEILAKLPKLGIPMILRDLGKGKSKPWIYSSLNHVVARLRKKIDGVPAHFTLDACRHGGLTELEEAELTDGQGRALSTHKTQKAYEGYAKRTAKRMLSATRKRHAHRLAEAETAQEPDAIEAPAEAGISASAF
ncbi:hypothetical protein [Bradyrhizobium sp. 2S1]|uniref:hypothetical protein n=1 Tax=Bradyrhizobium sp. 2S1 TaxID=1404429 RepID=UPI00140DA936|nr:hypothetical protein [Bradyrhizobium sp. 2S1]MCK7669095.1 hypothetical protein [Bradyrhizobium sp. 2S1]